MTVRSRPSWAVLLAAAGPLACAGDASQAPASQVGGVVTYRPEVVLPPGARLVVALADVTPPDAVVLSEDTVAARASPIAFELSYDPATIDSARVYAIAARIIDGVDVIFASPASHEVLTHGNPPRVEIPVEPASIMGPLPARAADIATRLPSFERIDGSWQDGDAASAISAYFDAGALRYLEERVTIGEHGSAANAYFFDQGALFYHETLKRAGTSRLQTEGEEIAFRVLFGPGGDVLASERWINGEPGELDPEELRSALRHAAVLREAALQLAAQEPTPGR